MEIAKGINASIQVKIVGKIVLSIIIFQITIINTCFSQKSEEISYIHIDSLMKDSTFKQVLAKSKNRDKIYLYNINFNDPYLGRIFILFNLYPDVERKKKFWKKINTDEFKNLNQIGVSELRNIVKTKINNYFKSKGDYILDFYIENIALSKSDKTKNEISSNLYVQFFTNNSKKDSMDFRYSNYINLNIPNEDIINDSIYTKKLNFLVFDDKTRKLYLVDKYFNNLYLFYRDIFNFIDYVITPKIIKGEVLKVNESFFLFKPDIGVIGRSVKKRGYKSEFFYRPVKINGKRFRFSVRLNVGK